MEDNQGEIIIYQSEDGLTHIDVKIENETVWLTLDQMDVMLKENLQYAFPDFGPYIGDCQFHDCSHRKEPGCAVRAALDAGAIEPTRYDSYLRLYEKASQVKLWELK